MSRQPRLVRGQVLRVQNFSTVEILLDLDFGVHVARTVVLEGVNPNLIPPKLRNAAQHALIILLGGKKVFVLTGSCGVAEPVLGRVYLDDRGRAIEGPWTSEVPGADQRLLEVSSFMQHLVRANFEKSEIIRVLNGTREVAP